jgi:hypothetical protein
MLPGGKGDCSTESLFGLPPTTAEVFALRMGVFIGLTRELRE